MDLVLQATATKDDAAGGEGSTAHGAHLNTEQMRSLVSQARERPSRKRIRPARLDDFEADLKLSESSELDEESEQEGAPRARKRQKKDQKLEADKKAAEKARRKKWRDNRASSFHRGALVSRQKHLEAILAERVVRRQRQVLVKWAGYDILNAS